FSSAPPFLLLFSFHLLYPCIQGGALFSSPFPVGGPTVRRGLVCNIEAVQIYLDLSLSKNLGSSDKLATLHPHPFPSSETSSRTFPVDPHLLPNHSTTCKLSQKPP
uniref:Uncharacterized protein n=1 Tax=Oryzias latipes TaxID=8090 RepID=A0A3P9MNX9_ORYLA